MHCYTGVYKEDIYRYYQSSAYSLSGSVGSEESSDDRANISLLKYVAGAGILALLIIFAVYAFHDAVDGPDTVSLDAAAAVVRPPRTIHSGGTIIPSPYSAFDLYINTPSPSVQSKGLEPLYMILGLSRDGAFQESTYFKIRSDFLRDVYIKPLQPCLAYFHYRPKGKILTTRLISCINPAFFYQ